MNIQFDIDGDGRVYGTHGEDYLDGLAGNDIIQAYRGNDILVGGAGNDSLFGGSGDDILIGVNRNGTSPGAGEIDTLVGSIGRDTFVLGDEYDAFYSFQGNNDYAVIGDFTSGVDKMQLHGSIDDYHFIGSGSDTHIIDKQTNDLIAKVENVAPGALLDDNNFIFV